MPGTLTKLAESPASTQPHGPHVCDLGNPVARKVNWMDFSLNFAASST